MRFRSAILIVLLVAATALAGCTAKNGGGTTTSPAPGNHVAMKDTLTFDPKEITISVGESVTWTNQGNQPHDVTPKNSTTSWSPGGVGGMSKGESFSRTFDAAGTYEYFCQLHGQGMSGKVIVTA